MHGGSWRSVRRSAFALAASAFAFLLLAAQPASAMVVDYTTGLIALSGPGPSVWDAGQDSACSSSTGLSPVDDGTFNGRDDAFDGGLIVRIDSNTYDDSDGFVKFTTAEVLTSVGGDYSGLQVGRVDTALQTSPTLRSIMTFANKGTSNVTVTVEVNSNLGSDAGTVVAQTSDGDATQERLDRWVVTDDGAPTSGDPVVTLAYYGTGAKVKPNALTASANSGNDCETLQYSLTVGAGKTRAMMFFAEMHGNLKSAKKSALHFDTIAPGSPLLAGVSSTTLKQIANWAV